jgi:iron complex outermembrane receptor protein
MGVKIEHNSFSGFEIQPTGRLAWTPTETQTFWTAVTRAVRTPSRIEDNFHFTALAAPAVPLYLRLIGDGNFSPEQLVGYEAGYRRYITGSGFISVAGFYNRFNDLLSVENVPIMPEAAPPPPHLVLPLYLRNGIEAQTKGVELNSLFDVRSWLRLKGSYSYMHLDAQRAPGSDDASTVAQLEGDSPRHKVVLQSFFRLAGQFGVSLTYRYVSALPGPDQKVPSYSTGDVRIARRIGRNIELSVVGQNLFQPRHAEYAGDPGGLVGIRRSAYLKLAWMR